MKKIISTIVAVGFISSLLVNTAYAGHRSDVLNLLLAPVAILSTVAAATIIQPRVVYERRVVNYEPRQAVIYEEPRHHRHDHYYERRQANYYNDRHERAYESPRYREYR